MADILDRVARGAVSDEDWDDFVCVVMANPRLEALRSKWEELTLDGTMQPNDDEIKTGYIFNAAGRAIAASDAAWLKEGNASTSRT